VPTARHAVGQGFVEISAPKLPCDSAIRQFSVVGRYRPSVCTVGPLPVLLRELAQAPLPIELLTVVLAMAPLLAVGRDQVT
jgi:hypothetical protein